MTEIEIVGGITVALCGALYALYRHYHVAKELDALKAKVDSSVATVAASAHTAISTAKMVLEQVSKTEVKS